MLKKEVLVDRISGFYGIQLHSNGKGSNKMKGQFRKY
jgi:hypothetical protein